ncbi:MAG TPA: hypothetical protein VGO47_07945 [Chlamydiales bacterium]|nr:hypothetical protein [Chlamydiales bacterium]
MTGNVTPSATLPAESTNANDPTQSKANVGAIAGGAVGGVVGVLGIIILVIIMFRRRKSHEQLPNDHDAHVIKPFEVTKHIPPPTLTQPMTSVIPMKLYDPADPSTFPPKVNFNPRHSPSNSTGAASESPISPFTTNVFSPTSGTGSDVGYVHKRQFSDGTSISSSSTTNVLSPTSHGRNISAESGTTSHNASMNPGLMYNPRV